MRKVCFLFFLLLPLVIFASGGGDRVEVVTTLVFQLGVILFAARSGGILFEKAGFPSVLGELMMGIVIGPHLLGSFPIPGFEAGLFSATGSLFPVSGELYAFSTVASILLLFLAGLETDIEQFLRYAFAGSIVGISGIIFSFLFGTLTAHFMLGYAFMHPASLFMGVVSTATSVGITARILSERRSMDSPEGVTILSAAVIDDVLGIILLAVIVAISAVPHADGVDWSHIGIVSLKAVGVWVFATAAGILFSHHIGRFLKIFGGRYTFTALAFAFALFSAGLFEKAGLAMIVGAYVAGLALSKTDISFVIQETIHPVQALLVPVFFAVMGMLVDVNVLFSYETIMVGLVYSLGAFAAKFLGCGIPALFLNFNRLGAMRVGLGMVPRGEVALIVAGIGLGRGVLDEKIFGISIVMTLFTTLPAPFFLNRVLKRREKGTRKETEEEKKVSLTFDLPDTEYTELLVNTITRYFRNEGFYINRMVLDAGVYQIRKDDTGVTMFAMKKEIVIRCRRDEILFVRTLVNESFLKLHYLMEKLSSEKPKDLRCHLDHAMEYRRSSDVAQLLNHSLISMELSATTKEGVVEELVAMLSVSGRLIDKNMVLFDVMERERVLSTGMQHGIAIPHARSEGVEMVQVAVGISKKGVDFDSLDGKPAQLIFLVVSSTHENDPHLQVLAQIASFFCEPERIEEFMGFESKNQVVDFFKKV